ncbi:MAG: hypothetical protein H6737_18610 [Alphaproteobacteria bacterium]|nr:hypothetical protein [Alphaproteobacteria bacterium]
MSIADLKALRSSLDDAPYAGLTGRFHSHLTVATHELDRLRGFCSTNRIKLTVVDLDDAEGRVQRDVMTTRYHKDDAPGAVGRIADDLLDLGARLGGAGFLVLRAKLEHESEPSLEPYGPGRYHEVHIKLAIPADGYDTERAWLVENGRPHGFVASSNPRERTGDTVVQFVNLRIYEGDRSAADARVDEVLAVLGARGLDVVEVKRETTVFDTHHALDRWWA